ncbi:tripartite motif-containing protein 16-like [Mercenaria mercenaria]|uniref:tripartite motif-containing protein 16-like n=1 Tax=Mercenaria mercenaria TaxID=6596 RepID=UPI00234E6A73|nr:tripartite motif-containing protein 16-like [Mercenaria mercenaria]
MTENDFYCDLCLREDLKKRGIVYCYNCLEILCKECERHHKKNKASISHKLIDISRDAIEWNTTDYDYYEQHSKCLNHGLKYVKFLCKTHGEFCCEKCAKIEDKKCRLVDEVELNTELKKTLEYMKQTADKLIEHESNYRTKLDAEKKEAQTCLENLKAHIDYSYEKIKNKILTDMLARRRDLSSASLLQTASVEKLKAEIRSSREVVEDATIQHKLPCFLLLREVQ